MPRVTDGPMTDRAKGRSFPQTTKGVFAIERRKYPRHAVEFPLDYSLIDGITTYSGGLTTDVSEGGLLVYLPERIQIGAVLRIEIFYTKDLSFEAIGATAKAIWSDLATKEGLRKHKHGLQFQSFDEGDLNKLKVLLKEGAVAQA